MDASRQAGTDPRSDRRFDLVLGGGGALGAFQAGIYEALEEAGRDPDRLVGTSIGALNAALIAGNPPERRLERLRAFWDQVAEPALSPAALSGDARRMAKAVFALHARLLGRPGLYRPHLPRLFLQNPAWGSPSLYHLGPALATLRRLVDFDRIGNSGPGLAVNLTDLETGAPVLVDSDSDRLRPEHLVASMGLLPDFPPTEIDGRWFCDGGFSANLPLHAVLDPTPEADVLCLAVDLLGDPGPPVFSLDGMMERSNDLLFANQTRSLATFEARYAARDDRGSVLLLLLACNGEGERVSQKIWDYGRRSLGSAGAPATRRAWPCSPGCRIFRSRRRAGSRYTGSWSPTPCLAEGRLSCRTPRNAASASALTLPWTSRPQPFRRPRCVGGMEDGDTRVAQGSAQPYAPADDQLAQRRPRRGDAGDPDPGEPSAADRELPRPSRSHSRAPRGDARSDRTAGGLHRELREQALEPQGRRGHYVRQHAGFGWRADGRRVVKGSMVSYVFEHLEIACYRSLIAAAEELGDAETARICTGILKEEQAMASWLEQRLPDLTREFLRREGAGHPAKR